MNDETINALEEALKFSPDNIILKQELAKAYFAAGGYERTKELLQEVLEQKQTFENTFMLAQCYQNLRDFTTALVVCEDLLQTYRKGELFSLYTTLLIEDAQIDQAVNAYQDFQREIPGWRDEDLEAKLKVKEATFIDDYIDGDEFMEKPSVKFKDVGGMEGIKKDIRLKIIQPLTNPDLYKAFGKKAGGGILLFGPPGCGKTFLAKATAGEIDSKFISVGLDDILDMWIGNSEKNLNEKFELARRNSPCVLFFDEIDALGSKRNDLKQSSGRNVINQFLSELDGVKTDNEGILILGATNSLWHMDSAFLRPGRFDRIIFVGPPDEAAREKILELHLEGKPVEGSIDFKKLAAKTADFSGADIQALIDYTVEDKLEESINSGSIKPISTKDLLKAIKKVRPSTREWFNTARNYALYSNTSGLYDDILKKL